MRTLYQDQRMHWLDGGTYVAFRQYANFTDTASVTFALTDDANNNEMEIAATVVAGGVDHGGLAGLADDDHTQYILVAGTRAFTGNQSMGGNSLTNVASITHTTQTDVDIGGTLVGRWNATGLRIQPAGVSAGAAVALHVKGTTGIRLERSDNGQPGCVIDFWNTANSLFTAGVHGAKSDWEIREGASSRIYVAVTSGNVGIGTTGPGRLFTVAGDVRLRTPADSATVLDFDSQATGVVATFNKSGVAEIVLSSIGDSYFKCSAGNVLIGTTTDLGGRLQVVNTANVQIETRDVDTDVTNKASRWVCSHYTNAEQPFGIYLQSTSANNFLHLGGGVATLNAITQGSLWAAATGTTVTGTEILRWTTAGVRIEPGGVTAGAGYPLHIVNAGTEQVRAGADASNYFGLTCDASGNVYYDATGAVKGRHIWRDNGVEKMRLTDGNVGIGTTSPAYPAHVYRSNTAVTGSTVPALLIEQASTGDCFLAWKVAAQSWYAGIDNSDSDKWKLGRTEGFGSSVDVTCDTSGNVSMSTAAAVGTTSAPDSLAVLDCVSTTKAFLPPRMTETERDNIGGGAPVTGSLIYNTTSDKLNVYTAGVWEEVTSA